MIWKVLKQEFRFWHVLAILLGMIVGFSIIMLSVRFYVDIKPSFSGNEIWQAEHLIISKKISAASTTSQILSKREKPSFTKNEIRELKKQSFIEELAPFTASSFKAKAFTSNKEFGKFYTELFFESVPSKYIDLEDAEWGWSKENDFVPIIIPKSYLNLYNFGFATAQNLPQISEEAAGLVTFRIVVEGQGKRDEFKSHIVGFSDRLNTILVPEEFLIYANERFGEKKPPVSRLILITPNPSDPELLKFIKEKGYDYNKEQLNNGKARLLLNTVTTIVLITGLLISLLALWMFVLSSQLLLQKNKTKIHHLIALGFDTGRIIRPFVILNIIVSLSVFVISLIPYFLIFNAYRNALGAVVEEIQVSHIAILGFGLLFILLLNSMSLLNTANKIRKMIN